MNDELEVIDYADNDDDLEKQWADWNQMTHHNRRVSDSICISKYKMTNLERYEKFKSQFNKQPNDYVSVQDPEVAQDAEDTDETVQEDTKLLYPEFNPSITDKEAVQQGGFYDHHGVWNNIMTLPEDPGRLYRGRVECLIIKGNKVYMCRKPNGDYRLPGGSFEIKNDNETQCYNECKEEARILIKNIKNTGITYTKTYSRPVDWARDLPVQWTGQYIEVYVADFDKYYNGEVNFDDRDEDMYNNGGFYDIDKVYNILKDEHKKAIDRFVRNINEAEEIDATEYSRVGVDLAHAIKDQQSVHNMLLKDGDRICVQPIPDTIMVVGAVLRPHSFAAEKGQSVLYYVNKSGGFAPDASKGDIIIVHGNGDAVPAETVKNVVAGDVVYVPNTGIVNVVTKTEKVSSFTKIMSEILSSVYVMMKI
jgi:protein involved in polysaccharide export with SLBB domain